MKKNQSLAKLFLNIYLKYYKKYCEVVGIRFLFSLSYATWKLRKTSGKSVTFRATQGQRESWGEQSRPLLSHQHSLQHSVPGQTSYKHQLYLLV